MRDRSDTFSNPFCYLPVLISYQVRLSPWILWLDLHLLVFKTLPVACLGRFHSTCFPTISSLLCHCPFKDKLSQAESLVTLAITSSLCSRAQFVREGRSIVICSNSEFSYALQIMSHLSHLSASPEAVLAVTRDILTSRLQHSRS